MRDEQDTLLRVLLLMSRSSRAQEARHARLHTYKATALTRSHVPLRNVNVSKLGGTVMRHIYPERQKLDEVRVCIKL